MTRRYLRRGVANLVLGIVMFAVFAMVIIPLLYTLLSTQNVISRSELQVREVELRRLVELKSIKACFVRSNSTLIARNYGTTPIPLYKLFTVREQGEVEDVDLGNIGLTELKPGRTVVELPFSLSDVVKFVIVTRSSTRIDISECFNETAQPGGAPGGAGGIVTYYYEIYGMFPTNIYVDERTVPEGFTASSGTTIEGRIVVSYPLGYRSFGGSDYLKYLILGELKSFCMGVGGNGPPPFTAASVSYELPGLVYAFEVENGGPYGGYSIDIEPTIYSTGSRSHLIKYLMSFPFLNVTTFKGGKAYLVLNSGYSSLLVGVYVSNALNSWSATINIVAGGAEHTLVLVRSGSDVSAYFDGQELPSYNLLINDNTDVYGDSGYYGLVAAIPEDMVTKESGEPIAPGDLVTVVWVDDNSGVLTKNTKPYIPLKPIISKWEEEDFGKPELEGSIELKSSWWGGAQYEVTLTNVGNLTVLNWSVSLWIAEPGVEVTGGWPGIEYVQDGQNVTVYPTQDYSSILEPGESFSFTIQIGGYTDRSNNPPDVELVNVTVTSPQV